MFSKIPTNHAACFQKLRNSRAPALSGAHAFQNKKKGGGILKKKNYKNSSKDVLFQFSRKQTNFEPKVQMLS